MRHHLIYRIIVAIYVIVIERALSQRGWILIFIRFI